MTEELFRKPLKENRQLAEKLSKKGRKASADGKAAIPRYKVRQRFYRRKNVLHKSKSRQRQRREDIKTEPSGRLFSGKRRE